jgi:hypothetical protein
MADRESHRQAREREQGQGPPRRRRVEPEVLRDAREEGVLELVDQLEEAVRGGRDRDTDDRGEDQELQVAATSQQDQGIGGGVDASEPT